MKCTACGKSLITQSVDCDECASTEVEGHYKFNHHTYCADCWKKDPCPSEPALAKEERS